MSDQPVSRISVLEVQESKRRQMSNQAGRRAQAQDISVRMHRNLFSGRLEEAHNLFDRSESPNGSLLDQEKRIRREIANSNERRRMQGINAGIQSLLKLLPDRGGEKLSKAAILHNAVRHVNTLEQEKRILEENNRLMKAKIVNSLSVLNDPDSSLTKRKRWRETADFVNDSTCFPKSADDSSHYKLELLQLKRQLECERAIRKEMEEKIQNLEFSLRQVRPSSADCLHSHDYCKAEDFSEQSEITQDPLPETFIQHGEEDPHNSIPMASEMFFRRNSEESALLPQIPSVTNVLPLLRTFPTQTPMNYSMNESNTHLQDDYHFNNDAKPSLETIVEAIKLVEGPHIFHHIPKLAESSNSVMNCEMQDNVVMPSDLSRNLSIPHQTIPSAISLQSRPGVIVINHS